MIRITTYFTGRVQGVGFRFTAMHMARGYQITGWVRNLPDGRVELLAEGDREEIDRFLQELQERMGTNIREFHGAEQAATGEFAEFAVVS